MMNRFTKMLARNTPANSDYYPLKQLQLRWDLARQSKDARETRFMRGVMLSVDALVLYWPLPGREPSLSQGFHGMQHPALDIPLSNGTPIYAAHPGKVIHAGFDPQGYAWSVKIASDELGVATAYAHLNGQAGVLVRVGQTVAAKQLIAHSDNTGYSTGPHLHFGAWHYPGRDYSADNFDPRPYLLTWTATQTNPPPPPPAGYPAQYRVTKPGRLSVYAQPNRRARVVAHYQPGQVIAVAFDYQDGRGSREDWVATADGYCLRKIGRKPAYLVKA